MQQFFSYKGEKNYIFLNAYILDISIIKSKIYHFENEFK